MEEISTIDILDQLKQLDLTKYPYDEIKCLLGQLNKVAVMEFTLHPGKTITRARFEDGQQPYTTRSSLCYKPQKYNTGFQRASTPDQTMFYGSIIPENLEEGEIDNERLIVALEASEWIRDDDTCGVRLITFSKWEVIEDIKLLAIVHKKEFSDANSLTKKMINEFKDLLDKNPEYKENSIHVSNFFANEFGKKHSGEDFNYMISAIYTKHILKLSNGFEGVLYPSVRVDGKGFNIAITPDAADNKIKLTTVMGSTVYKRGKKVLIDNNSISLIKDENSEIIYQTLTDENTMGENVCLEHLGVTTIEELCS